MLAQTKHYLYNALSRVSLEATYILNRWPWVFTKVIFLAYVAQIPFRNIAYYRHEQRDVLKDIGFEVIPEMNEDQKWISEAVFMLLHAIGSCVMIVPWISPYPHSNAVMGVVMAERWLDCLCVGHVLRFLTYCSTSLPGPAKHCRPGATEPGMYRPTQLATFFTRKSDSDDPNCGDLIFSGHMFQNIILTVVVTTYAPKLFTKNPYVIPITMWALTIVQIPLIVAARNHYTVDITVASYLAPLVWIALDRVHKPPDLLTKDAVEIVSDDAL